MGVTAVFIFSSLGFAIIAQAQQCIKPVAGNHMNLRDEYITQQTFADGSKVSFSCNPGYTSAGGSASITCTAGKWSPVQLRCDRKSCGSLGQVSNGEVDYVGTEFGDTATVTCNPGHMLVGRSIFRCEVNGWSGRLPTCDVVRCTTPPTIENGAFRVQKESYGFGEVVQYSCNKGLVLNGAKELTCSNEGEFSPFPPTCIKVECKDPEIKNAVFESGSRPPHGYKATVTYRCQSDYIMKGFGTVTCNISNQWSPSLPECIRETQPSPPVPTVISTITTTKQPKGHSPRTTVIPIVVVLVLICIIACVTIFYKRKKGSQRTPKDAAKDDEDVALS